MLPQYASDQCATEQIQYAIAVAEYLQTNGIDPLFSAAKAQYAAPLPKPKETT
jgi:hypothetical protein